MAYHSAEQIFFQIGDFFMKLTLPGVGMDVCRAICALIQCVLLHRGWCDTRVAAAVVVEIHFSRLRNDWHGIKSCLVFFTGVSPFADDSK